MAIAGLCSCRYFGSYSAENVVAKVGNNTLYRSDIETLIPPGIPYEDSIAMLQQYINSWALKYLLVSKAEGELSKTERDVTDELEDYRNSLLAYRYEKLYIEQRLDTLVTEADSRKYYEANIANLVLDNPVVKARVVKISSSSPNLARIRSMYKAVNLEEVNELERLCYNSADRYVNFDDYWIDFALVARELPIDLQEAQKELQKNRNFIETNDSYYYYYSFFPEIIYPGEHAPLEYYHQKIKESIISKRKQELIAQLEKDLVREALEKNTIKTTVNPK